MAIGEFMGIKDKDLEEFVSLQWELAWLTLEGQPKGKEKMKERLELVINHLQNALHAINGDYEKINSDGDELRLKRFIASQKVQSIRLKSNRERRLKQLP